MVPANLANSGGENKIPITLIEAVENVDAGQIYRQDWIILEGHELIDEIRECQGSKTIDICLSFIDKHPNNIGQKQKDLHLLIQGEHRKIAR